MPVGLVGLYLRLRLDKTPRFRAVQRARAVARWPVREVIWTYPGRVLVGFGLIAAASLSFNTFFIYLPSQLATELEIPLPRALAGALLGLTVMATLSPASGASPTGWGESRCWWPRRWACSRSPSRSTSWSARAGPAAWRSGTS